MLAKESECREPQDRNSLAEALRESEERFHATFNQAAVGMAHMTPDGRWLRINRKFCEIVGYGEEELQALSLANITHPDDLAAGAGKHQRLLRGDIASYSLEKRYLRKDGSIVWVNLTMSMAAGSDGRPGFLVAVIEDITERKMAEEAMRESEEKFSRAFLTVPSLLVIVTLPYERYVEVNAAFEQASGYSQNEVFGRTLTEIDIWEDPEERTRVIGALQEQGRLRDQEIRFRRRSGESFVGLFSAEMVELCGVTCMIGIITDITSRKLAEEALRRSEEKFAKFFHYVPSLLVVSSTLKEGRLLEVNNAFERAFNYSRAEAIGRSSIDLKLWADPEDRNRVIQTLREKGAVQDREINFRDRSGKIFVGLYSATIINIEGEECLLSIVNDITERKRTEKEIESLNASLAARALELETANKELEAFSFTVSHDLRRPLTNINGYCQVVQEMCGIRLDDHCREYLREIYEGTVHMNQLIDALLNFSRLAHSELHREKVDLAAMAREVAAELAAAEPGRRATFRIADGVSANGDPRLLRVVLENLLGNAWKYTGKRPETLIEFGTTEADGGSAFFVRDNGSGFDMTHAEKLFVPFRRLPGSDEFAGHGIGLATVERIIRRHGGRVWAEGELGKGAAFYFTLPG